MSSPASPMERSQRVGEETMEASRSEQPANALSKLMDNDTESEEEAPVQIPRGKLLARLQPQITEDASDSSEDDDGDAYERVKAALMSAPSETVTQKEVENTHKNTEAISSEDDEDIPVRTSNARRLVAKRNISNSPRVSPARSVRSRTSSPGLFVTPDVSPVKGRATKTSPDLEDADHSATREHNKDLEERIQRIRAERLAMQKERQQQGNSKKSSRRAHEDSDSDSNGEDGRRLTQLTRPTRKAGKKALEEMAREQQRIHRNMQLTHQSKTKKRFGVKDLFSTFGVAQVDSELVPVAAIPTPDASSDAEPLNHVTPPTSQEDEADKMETSESILTAAPSAPTKMDKGKGRAVEMEEPVSKDMVELSDSEDDLAVVQPQSRFPVFDKIPEMKQQEAPSLLNLRHLAHLTSGPVLIKGRKSMNMNELQFSLGQKARQQALREREEKIEDLKRRGIHIETEEERERNLMEIENMVAQFEKQRQEDLKLAKLERGEAKKNGEKTDDLASSDESEDDDYVASGEEDADLPEEAENDVEVELSGSEEEDGTEAEDEEEDTEAPDGLLDDAAEESDKAGDEIDAEDDAPHAPTRKGPSKRSRNVVMDDEDESETEALNKPTPPRTAPIPSQTQEDNVMAAFGFNNASQSLGLTQMFAGTMANMGSASQNAHPLDTEPEQNSLDFLRSLPDTQRGDMFNETPDLLVPNSQILESQLKAPQLNSGLSQCMGTSPTFSPTQASDAFEPTQDAGFELSRSPAGLRPEPSTIDTVMMPIAESPVVKKKGKLHQRKQATPEFSDVEEDVATVASDTEDLQPSTKAADAFAAMKKAAKKQKRIEDNFNKKTSWARDAIEEQAAESEDEYAGIGGASDDDSGEDDEELAQMIDTNDVKVDERKMAAYYAEMSKKQDEKDVGRLYKDLMNGTLRKRRGGDSFDMSDPEDEAEQRRKKKRMEFQKMTRALVADERIGKIAEDPKKAAFFQTLGDHMEDPDYAFLNAPEMDIDQEPSQSQSDEVKEGEDTVEVTIPDSQAAVSPNSMKRKSGESQEKENRPPPHLRRTALADNISRRPMTLEDVQHSVSELLEDTRGIIVPDSQFSDSDSELEIEPAKPISRKQTIDRLTMSRDASFSETTDTNLAFHAPTAGTHQPGFRVPSLIRRATSNFSAVSTSTSGTTTPVEGSGVRRGGTGRSNIHAQAREAERRAAVEKVEKKRKESLKKKVGKARGQRSVLGCLDGGFE